MTPPATLPFEKLYQGKDGSRNGVYVPADQRGSGSYMVNMKEIFAIDRIGDQDMEQVQLPDRDRQRWVIEEGDLLFARRSLSYDGAGRCVLVVGSANERTFESSLLRVRLDPDKADPRYYFYFFRSTTGRALMETIIEQVAAAGIRGSDLKRLQVPVPPLTEQRRVGAALEAFHLRLEAEQRTVRGLEQAARLLYQAAAAQGTDRTTLGALLSSRKEKRAATEEATAYIGLEHMPRRSIALTEWGSSADSATANRRFYSGDILFGRIRPYFGKVGIAPTDGVAAQSIEVLFAKQSHERAYAYLALSSEGAIAHADGASTGTTMPQVSWEALSRYEVPLPPADVLARLESDVAPMFERLALAARVMSAVTATRDLLTHSIFDGSLRLDATEKAA